MIQNNQQTLIQVSPLLLQAQDYFRLLHIQLQRIGIEVSPWENPELPWFQSLEASKQEWVLGQIKSLSDFMSEQVDPQIDSLEPQLMWRILNQNKFRFSYDLFEELPKDAIVEIYDRNHIQLFRSFQFLKICSYTLEDIYCRPWYELYEHDPEVIQKSMVIYRQAIEGTFRGVLRSPFKNDLVTEKASRHRRWTEIEPIMFTTFENSSGDLTGFLTAFRLVNHGKGTN